MKPFAHILFSLSLALVSATAHAEMHSVGDYKVGFDDEKNYQAAEQYFGIPFGLYGKLKGNGLRTSVAVYDLQTMANFDLNVIEKEKSQYYQGRKEFLKEYGNSKYLGDLPFKRLNLPHGMTGYKIGYAYHLADHDFKEVSYYISCHGRVFNVKGMLPGDAKAGDLAEVDQIVNGFKCEEDIAHQEQKREEFEKTMESILASPEKKAQAGEALRKFVLEHEELNAEQLESTASANHGTRSKFRKLWDAAMGWMSEAVAVGGNYQEGAPCFNKFWLSKFRMNPDTHKLSCPLPTDDAVYQSAQAKCTGENQVPCNPVAVGDAVCISKTVLDQYGSIQCNTERKPDEEIKKAATQNADYYAKTLKAVTKICAAKDYATNNLGLCEDFAATMKAVDQGNAGDLGGVDQNTGALRSEDYAPFKEATENSLKAFEQICVDEKGQLKGEVQMVEDDGKTPKMNTDGTPMTVNCPLEAQKLEKNLAKLDHAADKGSRKIDDPDNACLAPGTKVADNSYL